jgi:hypothetical protein
VLLGDPVYYKRFGFEPDTSLILADVPQEYFQALSFVNSIPCGQVTYHITRNKSYFQYSDRIYSHSWYPTTTMILIWSMSGCYKSLTNN